MHSFLPWPYPKIIAHRGGGSLAPENTLAAIRKGAELKFGGVEFDVQLAACSTPILMHDETLERTTNGSGNVSEKTYEDILKLDAGSRFSKKFRGEPVPTFAQAGALCVELGLWVNIEIKPSHGMEGKTGAAVARLAAELWRNKTPQPLLSSFSTTALEAAKRVAPELPRGLLVERVPGDWCDQLEDLDCISLHCSYRYLTEKTAAAVRNAGKHLLCYTVNDKGSASWLFEEGVDAIFTDKLNLIPPNFADAWVAAKDAEDVIED